MPRRPVHPLAGHRGDDQQLVRVVPDRRVEIGKAFFGFFVDDGRFGRVTLDQCSASLICGQSLN